MRTACVLFLLLLLSACLLGQSSPANESKLLPEAQAFENALLEALRKGDRPTLERFIAEGFIFIHSTGPIESRQEYINKAISGSLHIQRTELERFEAACHAYAGTTVICYSRNVMRNKANNSEVRMRGVNVYVRMPGKGWQWVSGQSTKLPVRPKAVPINAALYDEYVGKYEIDTDRNFTVTKENGVLFGLATGRSKFELIPSGEDKFVLFNEDNDSGYQLVVFTRNSERTVADVVFWSNGQETWRAGKK